MLETQTYLSAFLVGLLGGVHCVGMCGGIVGALTLGIDNTNPAKPENKNILPYLLSYNLARICSYTIAGILFGGMGAWLTSLVFINQAQLVLKILAGIFLIVLGLYLANWWRGLGYLEKAGSKVWKRIEPLAKKFVPIKTMPQAFAAGFLWGWLPCGLVYSVLIWSLSSGSALKGGMLMLSFGLGTLPNLLAVGLFAGVFRQFMQLKQLRIFAALLVAGFGVLQIVNSV